MILSGTINEKDLFVGSHKIVAENCRLLSGYIVQLFRDVGQAFLAFMLVLSEVWSSTYLVRPRTHDQSSLWFSATIFSDSFSHSLLRIICIECRMAHKFHTLQYDFV